jgi:glycosyltransferase involved in cell wall biosynthesis
LVENEFDEILLLSNAKAATLNCKVQVLNFSLKNPLLALKTIFQIRKITRVFRPNVIHIHQANAFALLSLYATRKLNIPRVLTAWGSDILRLPKINQFFRLMVTYNVRNADALTADSIDVAEEIKKLTNDPSKKILIANYGIQLEIKKLPKENIIYSNRLHKKLYRIETIINAFHKFIQGKDRGQWRLIIAATGEETEVLKKHVDLLQLNSYIEFTGWIDKLENANYYGRSRIFISIPETDATSISLLEAMASGCFPVLSDIPANRQWINHAQNGYIVSDLNTNFFEEVLTMDFAAAEVLNNAIVQAEGTKEANREKFLSLYKQLWGL